MVILRFATIKGKVNQELRSIYVKPVLRRRIRS